MTHNYSTRSTAVRSSDSDIETNGELQDENNPTEQQLTERARDTIAIIQEGKALGLSGAELRDYVREEKEREREERQRERDFRLEEIRLREGGNGRRNDGAGNVNNNADQRVLHDDFKPKLPYMDDKDDLESYLTQFERFANAYAWRKETWALKLGTLLKGKTRIVYSKMNDDDAGDYDVVKRHLLESFQLNDEAYRLKFRSTKKQQNDTHEEFVGKLELYFSRWIELANKDTSVEDLKDLMIQEQYLNNLSPEINIFIRERNPESAREMAKLAQKYEQARNSVRKVKFTPDTSRHNINRQGGESDNHSQRNVNRQGSESEGHSQRNRQGPGQNRHHRTSATPITCYYCKREGHVKSRCPDWQKLKSGESASIAYQKEKNHTVEGPMDRLCKDCNEKIFTEFSSIKIGDNMTTAFRDTGSTGIIVDRDLIPEDKLVDKMKETTMAKKSCKEKLQTAVIYLDTPYFEGTTEVSVMQDPIHPVLIGNNAIVDSMKIKVPVYPVRDVLRNVEQTAVVETRSQSEEKHTRETLNKIQEGLTLSREDLRKAQQEDTSLTLIRQKAEQGIQNGNVKFVYINGTLHRRYIDEHHKEHNQVVVPKKLRPKVLSIGHDSAMAGHLGQKKTRERIWQNFYWPGMTVEIKRYCMSCDICQKTFPKGRIKKVQLGQMPIIETAFKRVAVDIVGPIKPMSTSKKQYILVMVDYATRYPEAVALKDIRAETVAEALWEFWTRLGIPEEVLTDNGSQFTSQVMHDVNALLKIKGIKSTPWHPQCNGLVERFNGTLKSMLRKLTHEQPTEWDKFIPALLFAYREVPQESLGFSPFELLYGRTVRGPLGVLKQIWTEDEMDQELRTTAEYVVDLRNKIDETCAIARRTLDKASKTQAKFYNAHAKKRELKEGSRVLLLLPMKKNKLELEWKGPFVVEKKLNSFDYKIRMGRGSKTFHINLLKEYYERESVLVPSIDVEEEEEAEHVAVVVEEEENDDDVFADETTASNIPVLPLSRKEFAKDVKISPNLKPFQQSQLKELCKEYGENLTDIPKTTNLETCSLTLTETRPVYVKPRPIPHALVDTVEKEIDEMLKLKVIEPAASPYNSPIVLVKKKDQKSVRFCCDLRELNRVTEFDAEPITDVEHLFSSLADAKYFSKLDLTKGYWAIPIREEDRDKTAFTTSRGQFRWVNMPFGLKTAGSIFNRMMRKLLVPLNRKDVHHFMDDILIATTTWQDHLDALRAVLKRLKEANLSAKPSKCFLGFSELAYLGHEIGNGKMWPEEDKVEKIRDAKPPETKKELRAFLGLTGFFRSYVKDYSSIAAPLSDKTKKCEPEKVKWDAGCQKSFDTLKDKLTQRPVLCMPHYDQEFVLRTDASDRGMGAVLLQDQGQGLHPIAYASKKFNGAEKNYSTVEKECYATIFGMKRYERYLYGKHFILETDHRPLQYLQRQKPNNPRLMRWSLQLQPYSFTIKVIPGVENIGADYLSRSSTSKD